MMFNANPQFTIRKGDTITYADVVGQLQQGVVEGHGRNNGRRIVRLDNGSWCYREDVRLVARVSKRK
jgi:hypothetical protein